MSHCPCQRLGEHRVRGREAAGAGRGNCWGHGELTTASVIGCLEANGHPSPLGRCSAGHWRLGVDSGRELSLKQLLPELVQTHLGPGLPLGRARGEIAEEPRSNVRSEIRRRETLICGLQPSRLWEMIRNQGEGQG